MNEDLDKIYLSLDDAKRELARRQEDTELMSFVSSLLGPLPDELNLSGKKAVFVRYVATPSLEMDLFLETAQKSGLEPIALEFLEDKYVARNTEKYNLGKLSFVDVKNVHKKLFVENIIDFNHDEGKKIVDIYTNKKEKLVDLHHRLLEARYGEATPEVHDFSEWFKGNRGLDKWSYYLRYLSIFLCNGILFENFLLNTKEVEFTTQVVFPAIRTIYDVTGLMPLIVRLVPKETETEPYWCYYAKETRDLI
jgi:hypothetical protein